MNYLLNFELGNLEGEILINAGISNITQFGACLLSIPVVIYFKRKPTQIIAFSMVLIGSLGYIFAEDMVGRYILLMIIKFGIALSFIMIYMLTTEIYPTEIRGLAFGITNVFGRLGTVVAASLVGVGATVFMWMNVL